MTAIKNLLFASFLALAIGLVGCNKGDTSAMSTTSGSKSAPKAVVASGPELTLDQYNQKLADLQATVTGLTKEMQTGMAEAKAAGSKEAGLPKVEAAITKFTDGANAAINDLEKVKPPADLAKFHQDVIIWNRKVMEATKPMIEAAANSDNAKITSLTKELQTELAMMLEDYKADLEASHYDFDTFKATGKLVKK